MTNGLSEDLSKGDMGVDQASPLDSAIQKVQSYIADPKMVTPDTLQELLMDLMDMKDEESQEPAEAEPSGGGLATMMSKGEQQ